MKLKIGIAVLLAMAVLAPVASASITPRDTNISPDMPEYDMWKQCMDKAENARMFGLFTYDANTGEVSGRFVDFIISDNGVVSDYTLKTEKGDYTVFAEAYMEEFTPAGSPLMEGAMFQYSADEGLLMAHNNPAGLLHFTTMVGGNTVIYDLADGYTARLLPDSYNVEITGTGFTGYIINGNSSITIENSTVTVELYGASQSLFRAMPKESVVAEKNMEKISEKINEGKIIGEISVSGYEGEHEIDSMRYQNNMELKLQRMEQNRIEIQVSGDFNEGKCIVINTDSDTVSISEGQKIQVSFDGKVMERAGNIDEVLDANDATPRYYVEQGDNGYQISVYIPHFSEHTITVESVDDDDSTGESTIPGFTALGALGALALVGALLLTRRKLR